MNKKSLGIIIGLVLIAIIGIVIAVLLFHPKMVNITLREQISSTMPYAMSVKKGTKIKDIIVPKKEGYHLKGLYYNGEVLDSEYVINNDMEIEIRYESDDIEIVPKMYIVTFENSYLEPVKVAEGSILDKPVAPKKDGYTLVEWQLNGKKYTFTEPVTSDLVLTAVWEKTVVNNTTNTNTNKVNNTNTNNNVVTNTTTNNTVNNDNNELTYNITFKFDKSDAKVAYNGKQYGNNETLTVKFAKDDPINMTFVLKPAKYDLTSVNSSNADTEANGINSFFIKGFSSNNVTVNVNVHNTTTRTATVTFAPNNGQATISNEVLLGTHATPPNVTKENCTFKGWYQYFTLIDFNTLEINEPISVHAEWDCQQG